MEIIIKTDNTVRLLSCFLTLKAILSVIRGTHSVMLITMTDRMASHSCPADTQYD